MFQAGTAYSKNRTAEKAVEAAARAALEKTGASKADFAIFFASSEYRKHYADMSRKIKQITGADCIIGASGFGILTEEEEIEQQPGVAVMAVSCPEIEKFSFMISNLQENNFRAGEKIGEFLKTNLVQPNLLLLLPDPFSFQSHLFFDGIENGYGYLPIIGGAAAENGKEEKTYQIEGETAAFDSICGLALGGNFRVETGITRSCHPFGEALRITRAEGNMIYEMDGRPAYDILLESLSQLEFENPSQIFQRVFLGVPLKSFQTDFLAAPYLIRNIMGVNAKKGMLSCVGPVEEGEFVTFTVRDPNLARQDLKATLDDLKMRIDGSKVHFGFYFNCCARGELLYGKTNQDVNLIREIFPNIPIIGFFSYGEIAPVDHVNHFHHHSAVLSLVCES